MWHPRLTIRGGWGQCYGSGRNARGGRLARRPGWAGPGPLGWGELRDAEGEGGVSYGAGRGGRGELRELEGEGEAVQGVGAEVVFAVGGEGGDDRGDQVA